MERLQVPPIRTPLAEANGSTPNTAKEWYLYWRQAGEQVNAHADSLGELEGAVDDLIKDVTKLEEQVDEMIRYGTHADRIATKPDPLDALWVETDRSNIVYQARVVTGPPVWVYVTGIMHGTISPDQRPTDLGVNDTWLRFESTDTQQTFRWSGTAWVDLTPAAPPAPTPQNSAQIAYATSTLNLTTTAQPVPGCSLTVPRAGVYLVVAVFDFTTANDANQVMLGTVSGQAKYAIFQPTATAGRATACQQWLLTLSAAATLNLAANKTGGTGTSTTDVHTSISATWLAP